MAGAGEFGGAQTLEFVGQLPETWMSTIRTRHGRADARFHAIVATAFARDPHLVRHVTICTTMEILRPPAVGHYSRSSRLRAVARAAPTRTGAVPPTTSQLASAPSIPAAAP